jgi:putative endopeptidase
MSLFRTTALIMILAFAVSMGTAAAPSDQSANSQDIDRSIKPGDDFYRYANGGWLRTDGCQTMNSDCRATPAAAK